MMTPGEMLPETNPVSVFDKEPPDAIQDQVRTIKPLYRQEGQSDEHGWENRMKVGFDKKPCHFHDEVIHSSLMQLKAHSIILEDPTNGICLSPWNCIPFCTHVVNYAVSIKPDAPGVI